MSADQARILSDACELKMRVVMGQIEQIGIELAENGGSYAQSHPEDHQELVERLFELRPLTTELEEENPYLLASDAVPDSVRIVHDVYQVLNAALDSAPSPPPLLGPSPSPTAQYQDEVMSLQFSRLAAGRVTDALDFLGRIHMGQLREVCSAVVLSRGEESYRPLRQFREELSQLRPLITGQEYGHWGIRSPEIAERARIAYDLQQVIRHRVAWDKATQGPTWSVVYDEPVQTALDTPFATIEGVRDS